MLNHHIGRLATWLSKPAGFLATCLTVAIGLGMGVALGFNDHWSSIFNLFVSIAALLLAAIILVAGAKDTTSIQAKLDELLRAVETADHRLIGIDQRTIEELEEIRMATLGGFRPANDGAGLAEEGDRNRLP